MDIFVFLRMVRHDRVVGHIVHLRVDVLLLIPRSTTTYNQPQVCTKNDLAGYPANNFAGRRIFGWPDNQISGQVLPKTVTQSCLQDEKGPKGPSIVISAQGLVQTARFASIPSY